MDLRPTAVFLHNPSAATLVENDGGDWTIDGVLPFFPDDITACTISCATACQPQQWSIVFTDVDFGDCNDCGRNVSFLIRLRRQANFDIEDYLHLTTSLQYTYEPEVLPSGAVTAATLSAYFLDYFNGNAVYDDEHDNFGITASLATTTVADDTLVLTVPCPVQADVFQAHGSEALTITETVQGVTATLTRDQLLKEYPLMIGYVPGQAPDDTFTYCEDICVIDVTGCINSCTTNEELITTYNSVHLHTVGTKFSYKLFVNSAAPGYVEFLAALTGTIGACGAVRIEFGSSVPSAQANGIIPMEEAGADATGEFVGCTSANGTVSNGTLTVYWSVPTPAGTYLNVSDIITAINASLAGTAAATATASEIDLSAGSFSGTHSIITVNCL